MSYRDLRNLSEILRTVGYPRLVSLENFRTPNFKLVADIGVWMVHQYEPKADFPTNIETEQNRVIFIRSFAEFMATKVQLKLNTKKLYQADGHAVKELLKVAQILHSALKDAANLEFRSNAGDGKGDSESDENFKKHFDISSKLESLKRTRALASEITQRGVSLYDMLSKEISLREIRQIALSKAFEMSEVEQLLNSALKASSDESNKLKTMLDTVDGNIENMHGKIYKKEQELERSQKRLQTLKKVRPAFMDEYEKLQGELAKVYRDYVCRFKSLSYLQTQMEDINRVEMERKAEELLERKELGNSSAKLGEDFLFLRNKINDNSNGSEDDSEEEEEVNKKFSDQKPGPSGVNQQVRLQTRPTAGTAGSRQIALTNNSRAIGSTLSNRTLSRQVYGSGNMLGPNNDDSGESESDLILVDGENSDLDEEDEDELDIDLGNELSIQNAALRMARTIGINPSNNLNSSKNNSINGNLPMKERTINPSTNSLTNHISSSALNSTPFQQQQQHEMTNGHLNLLKEPQPGTSKTTIISNGSSQKPIQNPKINRKSTAQLNNRELSGKNTSNEMEDDDF